VIGRQLHSLPALAHSPFCYVVITIFGDIERKVTLKFSTAAARFYREPGAFGQHDVDRTLVIVQADIAERSFGAKVHLDVAVLHRYWP